MMRNLIIASALFLTIYARQDGAPKASCASLTPLHSGFQPQRSAAPYSISVTKVNDKIRVRIFSTVGEEFEGFVLQARSNRNRYQTMNGQFTSKDGISRAFDCFNGKKNTLTHINPSPKREIITEWTPADSLDDDIIFRATVAKTFTLFWTELDSNPIRIRSDSSLAGKAERKEDMSSNPIYRNCFLTKGCFGLPGGCINNENCDVLLSYSKVMDGISFELNGVLEPQTYMAVGISKDGAMGSDHVTECIRKGDSSDISARNSWNEGKSSTRTRELARSSFDSSFTSGRASCVFKADFLTESNSGEVFNLANNTYFILLAKGPMRSESLLYHSKRIASDEAVNFSAFDIIESKGVSDSIKIHASFMVTGWIFLVSLGILFARHFKDSFEDKKLCEVKVWFAMHRGLNILALCFVAVGFIVIFVHKNGWNYATKNPHAILGCITTALGLFQPIMAAFRPAPDEAKRPIFNWLHFCVGNGAQILAVLTIFFAVSLESSGLEDSFYWVMAIFVGLHLLFHLLFQIHSSTSGKKRKNEIKMLELNAGGRANNGTQNNLQEKSLADNFRLLLLGIYVIFLAIILLALYILIGMA